MQSEREYQFPNKENVMKQAVYFLGRSITDDIICQETEVSKAMFVTISEAIQLLTFEDTRVILKEADAFIHSVQ